MTDDSSHFTPDAVIEEAQRVLGDPVQRPRHYNTHISGVETIELCEWLSFNTGNALKYVWRAGHKGRLREDLQKALWYVNREHTRILGGGTAPGVPYDFVDRAQRVVKHEPKNSLLSVVIMQVAMPRWITLEHLNTARYFIEQEIAKICVHRLHRSLPYGHDVFARCDRDITDELTDDDAAVTCEECRRLAT